VPANRSNTTHRPIANYKELLATRNNTTTIRLIARTEGAAETMGVANVEEDTETKEAIEEDITETVDTKHPVRNVATFVRSQAAGQPNI
jgi:hypothetical protein